MPDNTDTRSRPIETFFAEAEAIVNSDPVISVYASCEWDELYDDGKLWIAAIVREAMARAEGGKVPHG